MASLIQAGARFNALDKDFSTVTPLVINPDGSVSVMHTNEPTRFGKVLKSGLAAMCTAAATLSEFNDAHPTLTNLAILSVQTALSGPTQFVKSYALEQTGVQGAIDHQVEVGTQWVNNKLVNQLSMDPFYASILTEGGKFGFIVGAGMLGAGSKDKIVDSAKGVTDKIKVYMTYTKSHPKGGVPYAGRTRGHVTDIEDQAQIKKILKVRDRKHHMKDKGFDEPIIDKVSINLDPIKGREQILVDKLGGAQSMGGTSSNKINPIAKNNPNKPRYMTAAEKEFS